MKLLSLNVRNGGGLRWPALLELVERHDPDVAIFPEWRRSTEVSAAEEWAASRDMYWMGVCDGSTPNGVGVASRTLADWQSVTPNRDSPGSILKAKFERWTLLACYFPQREAKRPYFDVCDEIVADHAERPLLIIGDINTGNQIADKTSRGENYSCAERFDRLTSIGGLTDLWRKTHGPDAREWTWSSGKNCFRLDHALANALYIEGFRPKCYYDHRSREQRLTDHSALLVDCAAEGFTER